MDNWAFGVTMIIVGMGGTIVGGAIQFSGNISK